MRIALVALSTAAAACFAAPVIDKAHAFSSFYAVINSSGSTTRGSGVQSSTRVSTGRYNVTFTRKVKDCGYVASLTSTTGGSATASAHPNPSGAIIQVYTFGPTGTSANQNFTLMVSCAP